MKSASKPTDTAQEQEQLPEPCPYCGYVFEVELCFTDLQMNEDYCWVGCPDEECYAAGPPTHMEVDDTEEETVAKAITAWNTRPIEDEMRADIERRQQKLNGERLEAQRLREEFNELTNQIAELRAVFFVAVPAALDDHRLGEMIGSPFSVLQYVMEHFRPEIKPDWSQAPAWAKWWAVNAHSDVWWFESEPQITGAFWCTWDKCKSRNQYDFSIAIPLGVDWRTLKEQRPSRQKESKSR